MSTLRYWNELISMKRERLTQIVFEMDYLMCKIGSWCHKVKHIFREIGLLDVYVVKNKCDLEDCKAKLDNNYNELWSTEEKSQAQVVLRTEK